MRYAPALSGCVSGPDRDYLCLTALPSGLTTSTMASADTAKAPMDTGAGSDGMSAIGGGSNSHRL